KTRPIGALPFDLGASLCQLRILKSLVKQWVVTSHSISNLNKGELRRYRFLAIRLTKDLPCARYCHLWTDPELMSHPTKLSQDFHQFLSAPHNSVTRTFHHGNEHTRCRRTSERDFRRLRST